MYSLFIILFYMAKKTFNAAVLPRMRAYAGRLIARQDVVLVGLSGGIDSVCLLHFLRYLAKEKHFRLAALHVNHGLRGKAALSDQRFCKKLCADLDIELICRKANVKKLAQDFKLSPEHAARKARYSVFLKTARQLGATKVALAHHLDDQAETFLLNLLRGTRAKGLAGMPLRRPLGKNIEIIRPLLCITRAEAETYLQQNKLPHITDESNFDETFTRNWIRNTLLPLLETKQPQIRQHLAQMAQELADRLNHVHTAD